MTSPPTSESGIYGFTREWPDTHRFHLVGIGGISMSGLAEMLLKLGFEVSGSDLNKNKLTDRLAALGATIYEGHKAEYTGESDVVVYSAAVSDDNPELTAARENGSLVISRGDLLAGFVKQGRGIAVAGTHGKSTTTTMIGMMLTDCGYDPTIIVGGVVPSLKSNVRMGSGPHVVVEADEYSRSFLQLSPEIAVVTTIDADHLEYFGGQDAIDEAFLSFLHAIPCYRPVIACLDDPGINRLIPQIRRKIITYGCNSEADLFAKNISLDGFKSTCSVFMHGRELGTMTLNRPGVYHISNALAAVATGIYIGIPWDDIKRALADFTGLERRFEIKGVKNDITVIDDYAHHPTEIDALLSGVRTGSTRVVAVFQPHLYSRTRDFAEAFGKVLSKADVVVLTDIYPSREAAIPGVTGDLVVQAVTDNGRNDVTYVADKRDLAEVVSGRLYPGDTVITIGAGDITEIGDQILDRI